MIKLSHRVSPNEKGLRGAQSWLESKLARLDDEQKNSILMAGSELLENAVKFHMERNLQAAVFLQIRLSERIEIRVTNLIESEEDASFLISQIEEINKGTDPRVKYIGRLKKIMEDRVPGESQLGLLRIESEGNFHLDYEVGKGRLTVLACKYINTGKADHMESLVTGELVIEIRDNDPLEIIWKGRMRDLNPSALLDNYLDGLIPHLLDRTVIVDFSTMDSINSSTIPPILTFLSNLEKKRIRAQVRYDSKIYWQKASFKPLSVLTRDFRFVTITAL